MTETSVKIEFEGVSSNLISNKTLYDIMYKQMLEIGMPTYTTEAKKHAEAIYKDVFSRGSGDSISRVK